MTFTLPNLPYAYDALAPHMSKETLEYHHDKHHQAYVTNGNNAIKGTEFEGKSLEEIVKGSFGKNPAVFNNAGQHYNHIHFWNWMKPNGGGSKLPGRLEKKINEDLGGLEKFKTDFAAAGVGQFGSGWCWLAVKNGKLEISKTPNGENPLVHGATPILGCDVWEHSYYIDYRNRRPDYLKAFLDHLVNWEYVDQLLSKGLITGRQHRADAVVPACVAACGLRDPRPFAGRARMNYLLVFLGGGLGASLRHVVNVACARCIGTAFPYGTFIINITGSTVMGLIAGYLAFKGEAVAALAAVRDDRHSRRLHHLLGLLARHGAAVRARRNRAGARSMCWARSCCRLPACSPALPWSALTGAERRRVPMDTRYVII